jgi:hypothetical protein
MAEQAKQIQLAGEAAKVDETKSKAALNMAKAQEAGSPRWAHRSSRSLKNSRWKCRSRRPLPRSWSARQRQAEGRSGSQDDVEA